MRLQRGMTPGSSAVLIALVLAIAAVPAAGGKRFATAPAAVPAGLMEKIESGKLLEEVGERQALLRPGSADSQDTSLPVLLYFAGRPSGDRLALLAALGIRCYWETWTPPLEDHPLGFVVATLPVRNFVNTLGLNFVLRMGTARARRAPKNNLVARSIHADSAWAHGWTGTGVKVAILDSGLDTDPANPDLPASIQVRDYSLFPARIGTTVLNKVTGHGTHVTGTVLGRGVLSSAGPADSRNGSGSFRGMAPSAGLVFLKIGDDTTASSTFAADVAAMHAAVDTFQANVLSMSYGGWDAYHDGSDAEDQVVDWVYSRGVPFFIAAGNDGYGEFHFSGTVGAHDSTALIHVLVAGAASNSTKLAFNLVWRSPLDSPATSMEMRYYTSLMQVLPATSDPQTTSTRGTNSAYSGSVNFVPPGSSDYYLRVVNHSARPLAFHIYEDWGDGTVTFAGGDPASTIGEPASADHACAVAAYVSRTEWFGIDGNANGYAYIDGGIAPWSSRGPRVDGHLKPDIAAPGSITISMRDRHIYTTPDPHWIAATGTSADTAYVVMQGTSMATPAAAGAAALILGKTPSLTAQQVYSAMFASAGADGSTGTVPNATWGAGKLNAYAAVLTSVDVQPTPDAPLVYRLDQNYPNPFNPSTVISYLIPRSVFVRLEVFDLLGRSVRTLVSGVQGFGPHSVVFDGVGLASGVYFYRLTAEGFTQTRKLMIIR